MGRTSKYGIEQLAVGESQLLRYQPEISHKAFTNRIRCAAMSWRRRCGLKFDVRKKSNGVRVKLLERPQP